MPSTKSLLSTAASLAASAMLVRTIANDLMPHQLQNYIFFNLDSLFRCLSSQVTIIIEEFDGFSNNEIYSAAKIYLGNRLSPSSKRLRATKQETEKNMQVSMERNEEIVDLFEGIQLKWRLICTENRGNVFHSHSGGGATIISEARHFELSFHKKHKEKVLGSYLQYILTQSKALKEEKKTVKLHTVDYKGRYGGSRDAWRSVSLNHPATFETLAMNLEQKRVLMEDLERFVRRKELYRRVGKAWKRGYLLYGPPGTGKSSLIAAMANFLNFDIYDLELTDLRCNSDLRRLLVATANRSILVVEDIDCSLEFKDRQAESTSRQLHPREENPITLSGLLNFIDGLWSSCGDERIIIFTTNHKDKIDPALLRPGRMDVHVHMSYCTPCGFTLLASNYLNIKHHPLFEEIVDLIQEVEITPAQVAEELLKNDDADAALRGLVDFLYGKKSERETTAKEESEASEQVHSGHQIKEEEQIRPC